MAGSDPTATAAAREEWHASVTLMDSEAANRPWHGSQYAYWTATTLPQEARAKRDLGASLSQGDAAVKRKATSVRTRKGSLGGRVHSLLSRSWSGCSGSYNRATSAWCVLCNGLGLLPF